MLWKTLVVIVLVFIIGVGVAFFQFRAELHGVYDAPKAYVTEVAQADLEVVEFVDYGCSVSKQLHKNLKEAVQKDGRVRLIVRPLTTPNIPESRQTLLFLYAAAQQGAFEKMNEKIFELSPTNTLDALFEYAKAEGLDVFKIEEDMKSAEVERIVAENQKYFEDWQIKVVPALMIATPFLGTKAIFRAGKDMPTAAQFSERFEAARQWF